MPKQMSHLQFWMMEHLGMPIRNCFMPPGKMLAETDIKPGCHVLDYGCGPGTFTLKIAERVGPEGFVHALDIHPSAKRSVEKKIKRKGLSNVNMILSDCTTGLPAGTMDYAILFDVYHELENPEAVLVEIHRVLKPNAILAFSDHHMDEEKIAEKMTKKGLFILEKQGERVSLLRKC